MFGTKPDYSGFQFAEWIPRDGEQHKRLARETRTLQNITLRKNAESAHGVRFSEFFNLPYFDPIEGHVVDPMHNLLLGTAKRVFCVWIERGLLEDKDIDEIDKLANELGKKTELGRTTKSMKLYKTMKAQEWKNWVLVYSLFCLRNVLQRKHFNMWQIFVRACTILLSTSIGKKEVENAHQLLVLFCKTFEQIIGPDYCTPNMHMHLHLKECITSFGPVYGFWAFSFERYNGILGSYHTNNRAVTITMMRKFINGVRVISSYQQLSGRNHPPLSDFNLTDEKPKDCYTTKLDIIRRKRELDGADMTQTVFSAISVPKVEALEHNEVQELTGILSTFFPNRSVRDTGRFVQSYDRIMLGRDLISTERYRGGTNKDHFVVARFAGLDQVRPATVKSLFTVNTSFYDSENEEVAAGFARVCFFEEHSKKRLYGERCPMTLWSTSVLEARIIPISHIQRKVSVTRAKITFDTYIVENLQRSKLRVSDNVNFVI